MAPRPKAPNQFYDLVSSRGKQNSSVYFFQVTTNAAAWKTRKYQVFCLLRIHRFFLIHNMYFFGYGHTTPSSAADHIELGVDTFCVGLEGIHSTLVERHFSGQREFLRVESVP